MRELVDRLLPFDILVKLQLNIQAWIRHLETYSKILSACYSPGKPGSSHGAEPERVCLALFHAIFAVKHKSSHSQGDELENLFSHLFGYF